MLVASPRMISLRHFTSEISMLSKQLMHSEEGLDEGRVDRDAGVGVTGAAAPAAVAAGGAGI